MCMCWWVRVQIWECHVAEEVVETKLLELTCSSVWVQRAVASLDV